MASSYVSQGEALELSNRGQLELLRAAVRQGAALRITARGHSMAPFVRGCCDVVTIGPLDDREPRAVTSWPSQPRRTIDSWSIASSRAAGGGWLVRGDNVRTADGVVARDSVLGRVVRVQRRGRDVRLGLTWGASTRRGR